MAKAVNIVLLLLSTICISATCTSIHPEEPQEPPVAITGPHVHVGLAYFRANGTVNIGRHGSGTVVSHHNGRTFILTAKHATTLCDTTDDPDCELVIWAEENAFPQIARVERNSGYGLDATIISTSRITNPVATISRTNPREGEAVFVLGSPSDPFITTYRRRILHYGGQHNSRFRYYMTNLDLDGGILPGFSGGGVYNRRSELVAMSYARRVEDYNRGVCIPIETLQELIRSYL